MSDTNRLVPLTWDSEHFGLPMGRIEAKGLEGAAAPRLVEEARAGGLALVEAFCEADDAVSLSALQEAGFRLVDVKAHLDMDLGAAPDSRSAPGAELSPAEPDQAPALAETFCRAFAGSRYLRTPGIPTERVHALYAAWIDKSVRGTFDHVCLTLWRGGRAAGVCTLRFEEIQARIGLFAVHDDFRGQGLGLALLRGTADHVRRRGLPTLAVATQGGNIPALRLYGRAGFLVRRMQLCMYRRLP